MFAAPAPKHPRTWRLWGKALRIRLGEPIRESLPRLYSNVPALKLLAPLPGLTVNQTEA